MRTKPLALLIVFLALGFSVAVPAQENSGAPRLQISEAGSFMLLSVPGPGAGENRPLWDDDLSSEWMLSVNGVQLNPAGDDWIRELTGSASLAVIEQSNRIFSLRQEWRLLPGSSHALVTASFTNNANEAVKASLNLLLDTALGEENGLPFKLESGEYIRSEAVFTGRQMPVWIKTIRNIHAPALTLILDGDNISKPERLVMANWRRLKEAGLSYSPVEGRNFDFLPFSRADSALLVEYPEKSIPAGESYSVSLVLGLNEQPPSLDEDSVTQNFELSEETENRRLRVYAIRERLSEVERELQELNRLLESDREIDHDAVNKTENAADILERRRTEYENL